MDSAPNILKSLTLGDILGVAFLGFVIAGVFGGVIFNMVMKRLDDIGGKQDKQGRNITRICTHLGIEEDT